MPPPPPGRTKTSNSPAFLGLRNIARIRFIDQSACHKAVRSLVLSRIDYCNELLSTIPSTKLDRVQRLQNCRH